MNDLEVGTFVMMIKNEDGSFSPVGMNKEQAYIVNAFLSKLSEDSPLNILSKEKYVQATRLPTKIL